MLSGQSQLDGRELPGRQQLEVCRAQPSELVQQRRERAISIACVMTKPVVRLEREIGAAREDDAGARHPVGLLAVDQVTHDIKGTERVRPLRGAGPAVIEAGEESVKRRRCPAKYFDGLREGEAPGGR